MRSRRGPPRLADQVLKHNCVPAGGSGVLVSTDLVREVGGFDPQFANLADWDLWIRLALAAPATSVRRPLVAYRVHAAGMAHSVRRTQDELAVITAKYADERAARGISIDQATWYRYFARLHLRTGDQRAAAHSYFRAAQAGHWTRYSVAASLSRGAEPMDLGRPSRTTPGARELVQGSRRLARGNESRSGASIDLIGRLARSELAPRTEPLAHRARALGWAAVGGREAAPPGCSGTHSRAARSTSRVACRRGVHSAHAAGAIMSASSMTVP